jgi:hypothetical protein
LTKSILQIIILAVLLRLLIITLLRQVKLKKLVTGSKQLEQGKTEVFKLLKA